MEHPTFLDHKFTDTFGDYRFIATFRGCKFMNSYVSMDHSVTSPGGYLEDDDP